MTVSHPVLCFDYGEARIGVAATDVMGIAIHPVESVECRREDCFEYLAQLIQDRQAHLVVVGLPLLRDGREGESAKKVRSFMKKLEPFLPKSVSFVFADERHTTIQASEKLREAGRNTKKQRNVIDQVAAMEILRLWLQEQGELF